MPVMSGIDAIRELRAREASGEIKTHFVGPANADYALSKILIHQPSRSASASRATHANSRWRSTARQGSKTCALPDASFLSPVTQAR